MGGPITALQTLDCDWSLHKFIEVNFSKVTDTTKFSGMNLFAFITTSVKIECKIFAPNDFLEMNSITTYTMAVPRVSAILAHSRARYKSMSVVGWFQS